MATMLSKIVDNENARSSYIASDGAFSIVMNQRDALKEYDYTCRVIFHERFYGNIIATKRKPEFTYKLYDGQKEQDIVDFFTKCEDKLSLKEEDRLQFCMTKDGRLHCMPSEWWLDPVRFTLLTVMMRDVTSKNIDSLFTRSSRYCISTKPAIEHFLDGNIFYQGEKYQGWFNEFWDNKNKDIRTLLAKQPPNKKEFEVCHHQGWAFYPYVWMDDKAIAKVLISPNLC